jgi:hypothetical protein
LPASIPRAQISRVFSAFGGVLAVAYSLCGETHAHSLSARCMHVTPIAAKTSGACVGFAEVVIQEEHWF